MALVTAHGRGRTGAVLAARPGTLPLFFLAAFAITWLSWLPIGLAAGGQLTLPVPDVVLLILGGLGPMLAALLAAGYEGGWLREPAGQP